MRYLNPLLLQAYKGIDFRPWLRGSLAGVTPVDARNVFSFRDLFRRGVFTNVALHARLERKHDDSQRDVKTELRRAGFNKELIVANVRRLEKLVQLKLAEVCEDRAIALGGLVDVADGLATEAVRARGRALA
jgi:hypothetical protein